MRSLLPFEAIHIGELVTEREQLAEEGQVDLVLEDELEDAQDLNKLLVLSENNKMTEIDALNLVPDHLRGLDRFEARRKVIEEITGDAPDDRLVETVKERLKAAAVDGDAFDLAAFLREHAAWQEQWQ